MFNAAPHPLTNFEIQKYQSETKFNGAHSRSNLLKRWSICRKSL